MPPQVTQTRRQLMLITSDVIIMIRKLSREVLYQNFLSRCFLIYNLITATALLVDNFELDLEKWKLSNLSCLIRFRLYNSFLIFPRVVDWSKPTAAAVTLSAKCLMAMVMLICSQNWKGSYSRSDLTHVLRHEQWSRNGQFSVLTSCLTSHISKLPWGTGSKFCMKLIKSIFNKLSKF